MHPPKIVFVEDEALLRGLLAEFFELKGGFKVVGSCGSGAEAIDLVKSQRPDLVLLDLQLPDMHGRTVVDALTRSPASPKIVVLSGNFNPMFVRELLKAGVCGILQKGIAASEVMAACQRVLKGGICLDLPAGDLRHLALDTFSENDAHLTSRETEILDLVARGLKSKDIASSLAVSVRTVEKHRENLMHKLGIHDVGGLVRYAAQQGIVPMAASPARQGQS